MKYASGKEIRDPEIERRNLSAIKERAKAIDVPPELATSLFEKLVDESVREQRALDELIPNRGISGNCVIYGGAGGMGRLFAELLLFEGYEVVIVRSSGAILRYPDFESTALPDECELSIVSVPMSITADTISRAANELKCKRIYEICSMKNHLKETISNVRKYGVEVVSLHPMFGPEIRSFKDKPVIFCGSSNTAFKEDPVWKAFASRDARLMTVDFEIHDRLMSYILQTTHALNIMYFTLLSNSGFDLLDIADRASPICERQLENARAVARQDPQLYFEIQKLSGVRKGLISELERAFAELKKALEDDSGERFEALMNIGKEYFKGGGA